MLTRRDFLKLSGAGLAGATLLGGGAGCGVTDRLGGVREPSPSRVGPETNVVLVIIDSLRKDHVGAYGNSTIKTPNLDALAGESLRFNRAYPESIPTICARRAIHTGVRTWPFRDWKPPRGEDIILQGWQPIPEGQTTLAETMRASGRQTLFVTDNMHQYKPSYNFQRGFDAYEFFRGQTTDNYQPNWTYPSDKVDRALLKGNPEAMLGQMRQYFANVTDRKGEEDWFAPKVFSKASEYLEIAANADAPFFLTVDCYDPHEPWDPPEQYVKMYDNEPYNLQEPFSVIYGPSDYLADRELQRMKVRYMAEITMMDKWLGGFLDKMADLDLMDNTLVVLLSDHGVAHGEHGYTGKPSYVMWPEITDIPFMIRHPGGKGAGTTSDYYASTHDVAPTILSMLGLERLDQMDGQDLSVIFEGGEPEERSHFSIGYNDHAWTRDEDRIMFAKNDGSNPLLFDLREDPNMDNDIAAEDPDTVDKMWNDYVLEDAGGPLPANRGARPF